MHTLNIWKFMKLPVPQLRRPQLCCGNVSPDMVCQNNLSLTMDHSSVQLNVSSWSKMESVVCEQLHTILLPMEQLKRLFRLLKKLWKHQQTAPNLSNIKYCTMPRATTEEMPSKLFLWYQAWTHLDLPRPDAEHRVCAKHSAQKQCNNNRLKAENFMLETESWHESGKVSIRPIGNQVWWLRVVGLCHVIYMDSGLDWRHVDSLHLIGMRVPVNMEPDIEPEIALPSRETAIDLASTSSVGLSLICWFTKHSR